MDLAKRLGVEQAFTTGKTDMDWIRAIYEPALAQGKAKKVAMPDFDTFWNGTGLVEFPVAEATRKWTKFADFRADPLLNRLPTASGKFEIYLDRHRADEIHGLSASSDLAGADRVAGPEGRQVSAAREFGTPGNSAALAALQQPRASRKIYTVAGREPCLINSADAAARGIANGDVVRLFNDRGQCLAGAVVTDDIMPGVVRLNEGGWYDPTEWGAPNALCKYGDVNVLTLDIGTSRLAQGTSACSAMAEVEKYKDTPPAVTAFTAPAVAM